MTTATDAFPLAYAEKINVKLQDGSEASIQTLFNNGELGSSSGSSAQTITQSEYDALDPQIQLEGEFYCYDSGRHFRNGIEYGKDASADDIVSFAKPSQLGLDDASCTVVDLINAMFLEQRKDYSKRLIGIFPYVKNESNITDLPTDISSKGQVEICTSGWDMASAKFTDTANCVEYIGRTIVASGVVNSISWQEIATKDNLIVQTVSNSSSATDKVPSANIMARELFGNNITDATVNVLEFGAGQWKVDSNAKASSLQNMPVARAGKLYVIHLQGNDGLTPYTGAYKYAMYKYITIDGVEYIRSLNSDGTVGHIVNDTGWKQIATKSTYNSIAELNKAKGTSITLVNGEDNTQKIVDALSTGEQFVSFYHNNANQNRFGIDTGYGSLINEIRIVKCLDADLTSSYATVTAFMNTGCVMSRIYYKTYSTDWCVNGTITELSQLGLTASATIQDVMDKMSVGQHCILNTSRFDDKTQVGNIEYGKVEIRRLSSGMWSLWLEDVLHGNVVAHGTCSASKFAGWQYLASKDYVDNAVSNSGNTFNGKEVKSITIDLSASAFQVKGTSLYKIALDNYISANTNVIKVEGYYVPPTDANSTYKDKRYIVHISDSDRAGGIRYYDGSWTTCVCQSESGSKKGSGYAKIYYIN